MFTANREAHSKKEEEMRSSWFREEKFSSSMIRELRSSESKKRAEQRAKAQSQPPDVDQQEEKEVGHHVEGGCEEESKKEKRPGAEEIVSEEKKKMESRRQRAGKNFYVEFMERPSYYFVWGEGAWGKLGFGGSYEYCHPPDQPEPRQGLDEQLRGKQVVRVTCQKRHTFILTGIVRAVCAVCAVCADTFLVSRGGTGVLVRVQSAESGHFGRGVENESHAGRTQACTPSVAAGGEVHRCQLQSRPHPGSPLYHPSPHS